jgi:hypothetical protein
LSKIDPVCAVIVRATVVDAESVPDVPVMVTVTGLDVTVAEEAAESMSPWVPVGEFGAIEAMMLLGRPLAESVTLPEKPPTSVTLTLMVALLPWATDTDAGEAERVKPGCVATATATVALPVFVESSVEVAVIVAVPVPAGVKTPALLTTPMFVGLTDHVTVEL